MNKNKTFLAKLRFILLLSGLLGTSQVMAFPNVCSVVKTPQFDSCMSFNVGGCLCGWPIPRPCAQFSYWLPFGFIEVVRNPGETFFGALPGAALQLATITDKAPVGTDDSQGLYCFHAHVLAAPFASIPANYLPCRSFNSYEPLCFSAMSEHLGTKWKTGGADKIQPGHLAWSLSPKACMVAGSVSGAVGGSFSSPRPAPVSCSYPMQWLPQYPPSSSPVCSGWGVHFPRYACVTSSDSTSAALMIASRMKSIATEAFNTFPNNGSEKWQMIEPNTSSCFNEGENVGRLRFKLVNERGRIGGERKSFLFALYKRYSCCRDLAEIPAAYAGIGIMKAVCQGL